MKVVSFFILVFTIVSCSAPMVYMDYDKSVDLTTYKSFDFFIESETGLNELDIKRVKNALENNLKQMEFMPHSTPDFNINFYAETYSVDNQNSIGVGIGGGNNGFGGSVSGGIPINTSKDMMALTLEFIDAKNNELFWQCVVETRILKVNNPSEREEFINEIIRKALETYPINKN